MTLEQPGHRSGGWLLALALAASACAASETSPPALTVAVSGCHKLAPGPACWPESTRVVRLLVTAAPDESFTLSAAGAPIPFTVTPKAGGHLLSLVVPAAARSIALSSRTRRPLQRWELAIEESSALLREVQRRQQAGDLAGAQRALDAALPGLAGVERARAAGALGRILLASGQLPAAEKHLGDAAALHASLGHAAEACDDLLVLAYIQLQHHGNDSESQRLLDRASQLNEDHPDGQANVAYFRGLVAAASGDTRSGLRWLRQADAQARRVGFDKLTRAISLQTAQVYQQLGKWQEMFDGLVAAGDGADTVEGCQRADWLTSQAWALLMARESNQALGSGQNAGDLLASALALYERACPDSPNRDSAQLNAVLDDLQRGDLTKAKARLATVRDTAIRQSVPVALWWHELQGRIAHKEGRFARALASYAAMEKLAGTRVTPEAGWRAACGMARAYRGLGQTRRASAAFAAAEQLLDDERFWVPASDGRTSLAALREEGARDWVDMLVQEGRLRQALEVARRAIRRSIALSFFPDQVSHLNGAAREQWQAAIQAYRKERALLEEAAARDWTLTRQELAAAATERKPHVQRMLAALDDAVAVLGTRAGIKADDLRDPSEGELMLVYFQAPRGWLALAATVAGVTAAHVPAIDVNASPQDLGEAFVGPFAGLIDSARTISIIAPGALRSIDFHALPVGVTGALVAHAPVLYRADLPPAAETGQRSAALIVADSQGDLPAAAREGEEVARTLRGWRPTTLLSGRQTTRDETLAALDGAGLFHYAGHAAVAGPAGWQSGLPFAGGHNLDIGDILALPRVPDEIVLSGCRSGVAGQDGMGEGAGIAQAFLAAGARYAIATTRPVRDADALALFEAYHGGERAADPGAALRRAQLSVRAAKPDADWAAFRVVAR